MLIAASLFILPGCNAKKSVKGGLIGAAAGGAIGATIGGASDNTVLGAIIGASVGGAAGALIGRKMDKQAEELQEDLAGATVERYEEGIHIVFDGGAMFAVNSSDLNAKTKTQLDGMAETLNKYPDTDIRIEGHTDASGKEEYNQELSEKRAKAVTDYLVSKGVDAARLTDIGFGENQPIGDNETEEGRSKNRRVDIAITANKKMQKAAKNGTLEE